MSLPADIVTILADLDYMAEHPELFTKAEFAGRLRLAAAVIRDLQIVAGDNLDYRLEEMEPEGEA